MASAESILSREPWFRWRFEIRIHAARAELSKSEGLCLLEKATFYRARKYMVAGHTILAKIAIAEGEAPIAEAQLNAAVGILSEFPAQLVAWKTYSMLGRVHAERGNYDAARAAFKEATSLITYIADHILDQRLRGIFLNSPAVQNAVLGFNDHGSTIVPTT